MLGRYVFSACCACQRLSGISGRTSASWLLTRRGISLSSASCKAEEPTDEPVKFSTSKAAAWRASQTYGDPRPPSEQPPPSQTYVVVASVAAFLIYFCVLREENQTDLELSKSLYDRIAGMEEEQIRIALKAKNVPNKDQLLDRLQEIIAERKAREVSVSELAGTESKTA